MAVSSIIDTRPTAITRSLSNRNFFLPQQAEFSIRRLPNVEFFCQACTLPGVRNRPVDQMNPFVAIRHPGDHLDYDEFTVTFKVDEYLMNYMSVYDWIMKLGFPENRDQFDDLSSQPIWSGEGVSSDCSIFFMDSRGRAKTEAIFEGAFPMGISNIVVDTTRTDTQFLTATATFAYTKYTFRRVGVNA